MKRFNKLFAATMTIAVLSGTILPSPFTCEGYRKPIVANVYAEGETTDVKNGLGVLIALLLANGIRFVGNFENAVSPGLSKLWEDFSTETGNTVTLATVGAESVLRLGYLRTSSAVNNAVNAFQTWYTNTFSVPSTGDVSIPVASGSNEYVYTFPTTECTIIADGSSNSKISVWTSAQSPNVVFYKSSADATRLGVFVFSETTGTGVQITPTYGTCVVDHGNLSMWADTSYSYNGKTYYYKNSPQAIRNVSNLLVNTYIGTFTVAQLFDLALGSGTIGDISMTGESLDLIDGYDVSNDQSRLYDIGAITDLAYRLGLPLDTVGDLADDIPLIMDYPWAETYPYDPTFADTPDDAIPWVDVPSSVIPYEVPEEVPSTPADEGEYKILGLERVFPFSIPFDLIAVIRLLNATPQAPEFTFSIYNPISRENLTTTMSFAQFESVAQVIRLVETLGFIVFLILITRGLIRS